MSAAITAKSLSALLVRAHESGAEELELTHRTDGPILAIFVLRFAQRCYHLGKLVEGGDYWDIGLRPGGGAVLLPEKLMNAALASANAEIYKRAGGV
jgi:hypothetical protein